MGGASRSHAWPEGAGLGLGQTRAPSRQETLEVRWIHRGDLPAGMAEWFGDDVDIEFREDRYLTGARLPNLSVKVRGGEQLDVKLFRGTAGDVRVPGRARGRMERWEKWTFPFASPAQDAGRAPGWTAVRKERRLQSFALSDGGALRTDAGATAGPGCTVELTAVLVGDAPWWTLGLEATGSAEGRRAVLEATAASVFEQPLPHGLQVQLTNSSSYAEMLGQLEDST